MQKLRLLEKVPAGFWKHAIKTGLAATILAQFCQHLTLAEIQYPVMGLTATMLSSHFGDIVKLGWGRIGGSVIAGVVTACLLGLFGSQPLVGALAYLLATMVAEVLQYPAMSLQAGVIAGLIAAIPEYGKNPWLYSWHRVTENGLGVLVAVLVALLIWPEKPRLTLRDNLWQFLQLSHGLTQACLGRVIKDQRDSNSEGATLDRLIKLNQASEDLLNRSVYGYLGRDLTQENWSQLLTDQRRVRRHLTSMVKVLENQNLAQAFLTLVRGELAEISTQAQITISHLLRAIKSPKDILDTDKELTALDLSLEQLKTRLQKLRQAGITQEYPLETVIYSYDYLHSLQLLIQGWQSIAQQILFQAQPGTAEPIKQWKLGLPPEKRIRQIIKTALGVWFVLWLVQMNSQSWPFGFYTVIGLIGGMQPTLGQSISKLWHEIVGTGVGAILAVTFIYLVGPGPVVVGVGVFLTMVLCQALGVMQGLKHGCFILVISLIAEVSQFDVYVAGRFFYTLLGLVIALVVNRLIWPEITSNQLTPRISQAFQEFATTLSSFMAGLVPKSQAVVPLSVDLSQARQNLMSQRKMLAEVHLDPIDDFTISQTERFWNFTLSYETAIFRDLLLLEEALQHPESIAAYKRLFGHPQALAYPITKSLEEIAIGIRTETQPNIRLVDILSQAEHRAIQHLEAARSRRLTKDYDLDAVMGAIQLFATFQELSENLGAMLKDWPSTPKSSQGLLSQT
ncbi:aromatic acid exporter family protein [Synechococcus sp. PCC 6312]|uniref:aromatic acid exporter family protein n=1 Tax=Synechococcus sp. (strain ATCC 27167 / PCC 6312) TaxID=195253 RepID=UPI00029F19FB|nr:aromatic acid exporter family protein [Synechococcus sp. PCC 6312]AFY59422.1 putative membrane protein [Synechococcus sp. PCC 6312]